jgi:hypothetical protein
LLFVVFVIVFLNEATNRLWLLRGCGLGLGRGGARGDLGWRLRLDSGGLGSGRWLRLIGHEAGRVIVLIVFFFLFLAFQSSLVGRVVRGRIVFSGVHRGEEGVFTTHVGHDGGGMRARG